MFSCRAKNEAFSLHCVSLLRYRPATRRNNEFPPQCITKSLFYWNFIMSESRHFYTQLLSISKQRLVETSFLDIEKLTELPFLVVFVNIQKLKRLGVIESFFNTKAYNKSDSRLLIGLAHESIIDDLFKKELKK